MLKQFKRVVLINLICMFFGYNLLFASSIFEIPGSWSFEIINILSQYGPTEQVTGQLQITNVSVTDFLISDFAPFNVILSISDGYNASISYIAPSADIAAGASVSPWAFEFTPDTPPVAAGIYDITLTLTNSSDSF